MGPTWQCHWTRSSTMCGRGNEEGIISLLDGDDGETIVALASTCKALHQNEIVQEALDKIHKFRTISPAMYYIVSKALTGGTFDTLLSDVHQFKAAVRYLSRHGPRFTHARDLLVQYRHFLTERREALRGDHAHDKEYTLSLIEASDFIAAIRYMDDLTDHRTMSEFDGPLVHAPSARVLPRVPRSRKHNTGRAAALSHPENGRRPLH